MAVARHTSQNPREVQHYMCMALQASSAIGHRGRSMLVLMGTCSPLQVPPPYCRLPAAHRRRRTPLGTPLGVGPISSATQFLFADIMLCNLHACTSSQCQCQRLQEHQTACRAQMQWLKVTTGAQVVAATRRITIAACRHDGKVWNRTQCKVMSACVHWRHTRRPPPARLEGSPALPPTVPHYAEAAGHPSQGSPLHAKSRPMAGWSMLSPTPHFLATI